MYQNFFSIPVAPYRYIRNESGCGCELGKKEKPSPPPSLKRGRNGSYSVMWQLSDNLYEVYAPFACVLEE
jgi:hypothetical protein